MKRLFSPTVFLVILIAALGVLAYKLYNASYEKYQITKKSSTIQDEVDELKARNEDLKTLVGRLEDKAYAEKEARKRLNVQKEGETTVIIASPKNKTQKSEQSAPAGAPQLPGIASNISHWRAMLFGE